MDDQQARHRSAYRRLLRFYPRQYRERFAEGMEQTFSDLLRERGATAGRGFVAFIFVETFAGIARERATNLVRLAVVRNATDAFKLVKYLAIALGALMVAGIVTLMILARGTGEDIAGIVAMALLVIIVSAVAAIVAAILQGRSARRRGKASNDLAG